MIAQSCLEFARTRSSALMVSWPTTRTCTAEPMRNMTLIQKAAIHENSRELRADGWHRW